jgi:hypothetical protein
MIACYGTHCVASSPLFLTNTTPSTSQGNHMVKLKQKTKTPQQLVADLHSFTQKKTPENKQTKILLGEGPLLFPLFSHPNKSWRCSSKLVTLSKNACDKDASCPQRRRAWSLVTLNSHSNQRYLLDLL